MLTRYSSARLAEVRKGGDFPHIAAAEEVALYIEVHMRANGVLVNKPNIEAGENL